MTEACFFLSHFFEIKPVMCFRSNKQYYYKCNVKDCHNITSRVTIPLHNICIRPLWVMLQTQKCKWVKAISIDTENTENDPNCLLLVNVYVREKQTETGGMGTVGSLHHLQLMILLPCTKKYLKALTGIWKLQDFIACYNWFECSLKYAYIVFYHI